MNPNIGIIGKFTGDAALDSPDNERKIQFAFDEAEISFQMVIDPYARADFFVAVVPGEEAVELEEAFVTLLSLPHSLKLKGGIFRSRFGKLNLTHPPEVRFADYPPVLINFFGEEGLSQTGLSLDYLFPNPWDLYWEIALEVTNGDGVTGFAEGATDDLLTLAHLKTFTDITESNSLELGATGLTGRNDAPGEHRTSIGGIDLTYRWKPLRLNRYKSFTLQTEWLASRRETAATRHVTSRGGFVFSEYQVAKRWFLGGRYDYSESPQNSEDNETALSAILTFWPSEFQTARLQIKRHKNIDNTSSTAILFQWNFVIGAHGAHIF